ncbi:MAG: cytidylate kinase family protein [Bacteroidia bacterium]|jgi:cytidylate kinase|nr:cytidylate kinase family protein [Bacteroidia bacterium]
MDNTTGHKKKIVLSGTAGSGKSTIGKLLSNKLGWPLLSMGDYTRQFAEEKYQLDINAFQELCIANPEIDKQLKESFISKCNELVNAVIDYRLGFHFIPDAFHVFLTVSDSEAIRRVKDAQRKNEDALQIPKRNIQMRERFIKQYNLDFFDLLNYDLVINTDEKRPEDICKLICIT